jgi:prepilin-type N-terminal cleavage/methylation domain-containing protein
MSMKRGNEGFSLLEVSMVIILLGLIFLMIFGMARVMTRSAAAGSNKATAVEEVQQALAYMGQELQGSSTRNPANYTIGANGDSLSFIKVQGYIVMDGEAQSTFSPCITYQLEGDQLVRLEDLSNPADGLYTLPGERKVLANNVQSVVFALGADGGFSVTITVRVGDISRHQDATITKTLTVRPQNEF